MSSPPTTLGQYQIIREIARSNDIVYEAYDPLMNRRVAVKELSMPAGSDSQREDRVNRFKREAQAAGTLNHPNIMTVYSFAEDAGRTFMAMEYLDGQTLRNEIDTRGAIPVERAVEIASAVLAGLEHAHSKGVIHRDIKPDNIQILSTGAIKITDFGIARLTFQPNLTMDGQVFGTPSYMSPEQVVGREIDARSDLFSVGVLLYEMLTGTKPFAGDSVVSITYAIMNREPEQTPQIPWAIWQVIHRALEKSSALRYSSAAEMKQALEDAARPEQAKGMPMIDPMTGTQNPYLAANPYGTPQAPPVSGPIAPQTNPYNPYGQPNAGANPYAGQYGQAPMPPPVSNYPYNPYQQATGGGFPQQIPGAGPPIPVYYPPPPRQPLFKPDTIIFMKKLALAILVMGTLVAVVLVGFNAVSAIIQKSETDRQWNQQQQQLVQDKQIPLDDQITQEEQQLKSASDANQQVVKQHLALLYDEKAGQDFKGGDFFNSEAHLQKAVEYDPHNPNLFFDLGNLYASQAEKLSDFSDKANLHNQSAEAYQKAFDQESRTKEKSDDGLAVAREAYYFAYNANLSNEPDLKYKARAALESAQVYADADPSLKASIADLLAQMRSP